MIEVVDEREKRANMMVMRGYATMLELLTASFGEWPPKGLDIGSDIKHDQKVNLHIFFEENLLGQASSVTDKERKISIHDRLVKKGVGLYSTLGHESIHILQGDNAFRKKDAYGKQMSLAQKMMYGVFGQEQPTSNLIMGALVDEKSVGGFCSEFNAAASRLSKDGWRKEIKHINYLREGIEIQARIHQLVIDGYTRWGKVPATQDEFYAAMKNAGCKLPPEIEKRLENLPANSSARHFLKCEGSSAAYIKDKVSQIAEVNDSLPKSGQQVLWNKVMPALYADLIEMYGDKQGGQKMGFSTKLQTEVAKTVKTTLTAKQTSPSLS